MSTQEQQNVPKVKYSKALLSPKNNYFVEVDSGIAREVLLRAGVPENKINTLTIHVKNISLGDRGRRLIEKVFKKNTLRRNLGSYSNRKKEISLYVHPYLDHYRRNVKTANILAGAVFINSSINSIIPGQSVQSSSIPIENMNYFVNSTFGERLSRYLMVAPIPRSLETANKLFQQEAEGNISETFYHEAKHAGTLLIPGSDAEIQHEKMRRGLQIQTYGIVIADAIGTSVINNTSHNRFAAGVAFITGVGLMILNRRRITRKLYEHDPLEIEARKFGTEIGHMPSYRIAKITQTRPVSTV